MQRQVIRCFGTHRTAAHHNHILANIFFAQQHILNTPYWQRRTGKRLLFLMLTPWWLQQEYGAIRPCRRSCKTLNGRNGLLHTSRIHFFQQHFHRARIQRWRRWHTKPAFGQFFCCFYPIFALIIKPTFKASKWWSDSCIQNFHSIFLQPMYADDERFYYIYEKCENEQIPLMMAFGGFIGPDYSYCQPLHIDPKWWSDSCIQNFHSIFLLPVPILII